MCRWMATATPADAKGLLKSAIRDDNPVVMLEGEMLYNTKGEVPEEEYVVPIGKAEVKRECDHCGCGTQPDGRPAGENDEVAAQRSTCARLVVDDHLLLQAV